MKITEQNVDRIAAVLYTSISVAAAGAFFLATLLGDYGWVSRLGGAGWIFLLAMIILMPTVGPFLRSRIGAPAAPMPEGHH